MVGEEAIEETQSPIRRRADRRQARAGIVPLITFLLAVGVVIAYALPDGTYGLVTRQEYGLVLWALLGFGWASGALPRAWPSGAILILLGLLVMYAGWTALSLTWTESSERTSAEVARVVGYTGLVAVLASLLDRRTWRIAAMGAGFGSLLVCAFAVASRLAPLAFPANPLLQPHGTNRLSYPFGYWNAVGDWGAMSAAIGLAWSAHDPLRWRRAIALAGVPLAVSTTYLSYSRAGIAGLAVGLVLVLALSRDRLTALAHALIAAVLSAVVILVIRGNPQIAHGTGTGGASAVLAALVLAAVAAGGVAVLTGWAGLDRRRVPRLLTRAAVVGAAFVLAVAATGFGPHLVKKAWHQFRLPALVTTTDPASRLTQLSGTRYGIWRSAVRAFEHHPVAGTGAGTFAFWWDRAGSDSEAVRNAHSFELENLAELGLVGLVLIVAIMVTGLWVLGRVRRLVRRNAGVGVSTAMLAAFCVYVVQASVDWMWQVTAVTALALGAVAIAGARLSAPRGEIGWIPKTGVTVAALLAALVQLPGLVSTTELNRSQQAERAGNAGAALAWANAAVSAEPWSASAYEQHGLVLEAAGRLEAAATDLRRAIDNERTNFRHWLILSRIETEQGNLAAAVRDYNEARRLRPRALVFLYSPYFIGAPRIR